jgi:hypothetical protein
MLTGALQSVAAEGARTSGEIRAAVPTITGPKIRVMLTVLKQAGVVRSAVDFGTK